MQRLPPRNYVQARAFELQKGQALALEPFRQRLAEAGYASVSQVISPGEFAVRGSLLDVFPDGRGDTAAHRPVRRGDRGDPPLRSGHAALARCPRTMCTCCRRARYRSTPQAVKDFRRRYRTRFEGDPNRSAIYRGVSEGLAPAGVEFYQPLFFESTTTLLRLPAGERRARAGRRAAARPRPRPGRTSRHATRTAATTSSARCSAPRSCSYRPAELARAARWLRHHHARCVQGRYRAAEGGRAGAQLSRPARRASCVWMCAPSSPFAPLDAFLKAFDGRVLHRRRLGRPARGAAGDAARLPPRGAHRRRLGRLCRRERAARAHRRARPGGTDPHRPADRAHLRGAAVRRARPPGAPPQARRGPGGDPARPARPQARRARWCTRNTASGATSDSCRWRSAGSPGSSSCSSTRTATASTCRCSHCTW